MRFPGFTSVRLAVAGIILLALVAALAIAVWMTAERREEILLPTLGLVPAESEESRFLGKLVGRKGETDIHLFDTEETAKGFTAPPDAHIVFAAPSAISPGMEVDAAHGDPRMFREVRYWGYEYSGNEAQNKKAGKTGRELFDGKFWLSDGELAVTGDRYGYLHTTDQDGSAMDVAPLKRYYLMLDGATLGDGTFRVSFLDDDHDRLNNAREDQNGNGAVDAGETDPKNPDTDGDGLKDGAEVFLSEHPAFGARLNPLSADTDEDGKNDEEVYKERGGCQPPETAECPGFISIPVHIPSSKWHDFFLSFGHAVTFSAGHSPAKSEIHHPVTSSSFPPPPPPPPPGGGGPCACCGPDGSCGSCYPNMPDSACPPPRRIVPASQCPKCPESSGCTTDSDCDDKNKCTKDVCTPDAGGSGKGKCSNEKTVPRPPFPECQCRAGGEKCEEDADCCSSTEKARGCFAGTCVCRGQGWTCDEDADCCSGTCVSDPFDPSIKSCTEDTGCKGDGAGCSLTGGGDDCCSGICSPSGICAAAEAG